LIHLPKVYEHARVAYDLFHRSTTYISLEIIAAVKDDFEGLLLALPQQEDDQRPRPFITLSISLAAMVLSTYNAVHITQLYAKRLL
jgi:hypothetical protein